MGIKRYIAVSGTTITNAYMRDNATRGTGSNMGAADSAELFHLYAQANSSSSENSRILAQFNTTTISTDRTAATIPASGSVGFYLKMFNAPHPFSLAKKYYVKVLPISQSWEEGTGLDADEYKDLTYDCEGANWINAASGTAWTTEGGDFLTSPEATQYFTNGEEHLEIDISYLVEQWLAGGVTNHGVGIMLSGSYETGATSYYTKKFFTRSSEFYMKRPIIEARWNSSIKDKRGNYYISSSLLSAAANSQTFYIYNRPFGTLTDIPNLTGFNTNIFVKFYTSSSAGEELTSVTPNYPVTGGWVSTGIYSASFALSTTASLVYDRWYSGSNVYLTGSFKPKALKAQQTNVIGDNRFIASIFNLKNTYTQDEYPRLRVFTRQKGWCPSVYTTHTCNNVSNMFLESLYYKVYRTTDDFEVIPYGTGSYTPTKLSYDVSGSYFDLNMKVFQEDYSYNIKFGYTDQNSQFVEIEDTFKFRIE